MRSTHRLIHALFVLALPIIVAAWGWSVTTACLAVLLGLLWRQFITLASLLKPAKAPELELDTILPSHFVEKVRWCMDRLGVPYTERPAAAVIGALFTGRTVPRLRVRTGRVQSVIGESSAILRFLWGRYAAPMGSAARFLEPTEERLALEQQIDQYGRYQQVWIYYHLLSEPALCRHVWGRNSAEIAFWQRWLLEVLFPVLRVFIRRAFNPNEAHYRKIMGRTDRFLEEIETRLGDGRRHLLGGAEPDYVDLSLAAMSSLWVQPAEFAGGRAASVRTPLAQLPDGIRTDINRWRMKFPVTTEYIERLYREERACP